MANSAPNPAGIGLKLQIYKDVLSTDRPENLVKNDLRKYKSCLLESIDVYQPVQSELKGTDQTDAVKKLGCGPLQSKLLKELSDFLNLKLEVCKDLFTSWLMAEYKESRESLKTVLSDERLRFALLEKLNVFYYSDRTYSLTTLKYILTSAFNQENPYQKLYRDLIDDISISDPSSQQGLFSKLMKQYEDLYNTTLPNFEESELHHLWTESHIQGWCYQTLREQIIILECMVIYLYHTETPINHLLNVINSFKSKSLTGQVPSHIKHIVSDSHQQLLARIRYLQTNLTLISMQFKSLHTIDFRDMNELSVMFMNRLGDYSPHGPVLLGWAVVLSHHIKSNEKAAASLTMHLDVVGEKALALPSMSYLLDMVSQLQTQEISDQLSASTLYHMLSLLLNSFDDTSLSEGDNLYNVVSSLMRFDCNINSLLQCDVSDGVLMLIRKLLSDFPLIISRYPLFKILSQISLTNKSGAKFVIDMIVNLSTFTEVLDHTSDVQLISNDEIELRSAKPIFGEEILRAGIIGLIKTIYDGSCDVVQWQYVFNGWDLIINEIEVIANQAHLLPDRLVQERLMMSCNLLSSIFKHAPCTSTHYDIINEYIYRILYSLCCLDEPPLDTISDVLNLISSLSTHTPESTLQKMSSLYLPNVSTGEQGSLLSHILYSSECVMSRYPCLLSSLKMLCNVITNINQSSTIVYTTLKPVFEFLLEDVFINHHSWRFDELVECDLISELCLELIHTILDWSDSSELKSDVIKLLLHTSQTHQILSSLSITSELLDIIRLNEHNIPVTSCRERDAPPSTIYRISLALSIVRRLIQHSAKLNVGDDVLSSALSTRCRDSGLHVTAVISSYTYHRHDSRLAILSTQLLQVLAEKTNLSLLTGLGETAVSVKTGLLRRLSSQSEDPRLKTVILELLTTCVDKQPAMLEFFLKPVKREAELLPTITNLISLDRQFTHVCPGELLLANFNFLLSLWVSAHNKLTQQLSNSSTFWESLFNPLDRKLGDISSGSTSHPNKSKIFSNILQITAHQLYTKDSGCKEFHTAFNEVKSTSWLSLSKFVSSELRSLTLPIQHTDSTLILHSTYHLLDSWSMFLSVLHRFKSDTVSEADKVQFIKSGVDSLRLLVDVENKEALKTAALLSNSVYHMLIYWQRQLSDWNGVYTSLIEMLHHVSGGNIPSIQPSVYTPIILSIKLLTHHKIKPIRNADKTPDNVQILLSSLVDMLPVICDHVNTGEDNSKHEQLYRKLRQVCLSCLHELVLILPEKIYVTAFHENYTMYNLLQSLSVTIQKGDDSVFVDSCLAFLYYLSRYQNSAKLVQTCITEHITLTTLKMQKLNTAGESNKMSCDTGTFVRITGLFSLMLRTLSHQFVKECTDYISVNIERFEAKSQQLVYQLSAGLLEELKSFCHLMGLLSAHRFSWTNHTGHDSITYLTMLVCRVFHDCLALLQRPMMIEHLIIKSNSTNQTTRQEPRDVVPPIRQLLLDVLIECIVTMRSFSPDLVASLIDPGLDLNSYRPLIEFGFTSPVLDNRPNPNFGTLTAACGLTISMITNTKSHDRSPSRNQISDEEVELLRSRLLYILENCVLLIMSQCTLYLRANQLDQRDVKSLKRELSTELSSCLSGVARYYKKLNPVSPAASSSKSAVSPLSKPSLSPSRSRSLISPLFSLQTNDQAFYNLVDHYVKSILK